MVYIASSPPDIDPHGEVQYGTLSPESTQKSDASSTWAAHAESLSLITKGLPCAAALVAPDGRLIAHSDAFAALDLVVGDGPGICIDLGSASITGSNETLPKFHEDIARVMNDSTTLRRSLTISKPTESDTYLDITYHPWRNPANSKQCALVLASDVTERFVIEKQLREANNELTQLQYHLSHDLAAPIASARGLLQLVAEDVAEHRYEELPEMLEETEDQLVRLNNLVGELMLLARAGTSDSLASTFDLRDLVDEIVVSNSLHSRELELSVTLLGATCQLQSDRIRVKQILTNLISNARKFRDNQESAPEVTVTATECNIGYRIEVSDNGVGVPVDMQDKIFDMFVRGSKDYPGHGLGLYIVRKHVANLGGTLSISHLAKPTVFTVCLPKMKLPEN